MARLSDEHETRMSLALAGSGGIKGGSGAPIWALRGYREGCLAILGFEGSAEDVNYRRGRALALARGFGGARRSGARPGEAWRASRFAAPYLRDELLTHGVMVETLETAAQWSNLGDAAHGGRRTRSPARCAQWQTPGLRDVPRLARLRDRAPRCTSRSSPASASRTPIGQWQAVKHAAGEAIMAGGGTITHHHAVGRDHAPWMAREVGELGLRRARAR